MEFRQRRFMAAVILAISMLIVVYLIFRTPSESTISTPTPSAVEPTDAISTRSLSSQENFWWRG